MHADTRFSCLDASSQFAEFLAQIMALLTDGLRVVGTLESPATVGKAAMETLVESNRWKVFHGSADETAIMSQEEIDLVVKNMHAAAAEMLQNNISFRVETLLIKVLTPYLHKALLGTAHDLKDNCLVLLNSENFTWLPDPRGSTDADLKPDLVTVYNAFVHYKHASIDQDQGDPAKASAYLFGKVFAGAAWPQVITGIFEAKMGNLGNEEIGRSLLYLKRIPGLARCMLFNTENFLLLDCCEGTPARASVCLWTEPGSLRHLQKFFERQTPKICQLLDFALTAMGVSLRVCPDSPAYLGSGAFGHVFRVERDGHEFALKIVLGSVDAQRDVFQEYARIQEAERHHVPVIAAVGDSLVSCDLGACYMMVEVASRAPATTLSDLKRAISCLSALHSTGLYHGDARFPNLLQKSNGTLRG
jgi:hypothetical protein